MIQNFISKLNEKQRKIFYVAAAVVSLALVDRLFFGPILDKINFLNEEIALQKESISRDLKFLGYNDRILKNSQVFSKYFSQVSKDEDVVNAEFLSLIERLASQAKVNLVKSNPAEGKKEKNYSEYAANLDCSGQLKDVISFMHFINSSEELLKITRFNMSPKRGVDGEVNASMTVAKMIVNPDSVENIIVPSKK